MYVIFAIIFLFCIIPSAAVFATVLYRVDHKKRPEFSALGKTHVLGGPS